MSYEQLAVSREDKAELINLMGFCGETGFANYPISVSLDRPVFSPFRGWSQRLPRNKNGIIPVHLY